VTNVKTVGYELARLRCEQRGVTVDGRGSVPPDAQLSSLVHIVRQPPQRPTDDTPPGPLERQQSLG